MDKKDLIVISCSSLLALAWQAPLAAVEVYQWVDENGVTHFSQWAPAGPVEGVNKRTLADEAPAVDPDEDRYAVEQTAKEMEALREELALKREQRRRQETASRSAPQGVQVYQDNVDYPYWPGNFPHRPNRPDWKPDRPDRPDRPGGRPPLTRPNPPVAPPAAVPFRRSGN